MSSFDLVLELARHRRGLVTYDEMTTAGVPRSSIGHWARTGRLRRVQPRVYAVASSADTWEQRILAAVLSCGGAAHLRSAARLWNLLETDHLDVLVTGATPRLSGCRIHWASRAPEVTVRHGIRVTTPPYTIVSLGSVVARQELEDAVSRALTSRLVTVSALEAALERIGGQGVRGTRLLRSVLGDWELGARPPDSVLETRMLSLLRRYRLPRPVFQHPVAVAGELVARVDFAYPDALVALEVDGAATHTAPLDRARDSRRRNRLESLGWSVLTFTWAQVTREAHDVAAQVAAQLACSARQANQLASRAKGAQKMA